MATFSDSLTCLFGAPASASYIPGFDDASKRCVRLGHSEDRISGYMDPGASWGLVAGWSPLQIQPNSVAANNWTPAIPRPAFFNGTINTPLACANACIAQAWTPDHIAEATTSPAADLISPILHAGVAVRVNAATGDMYAATMTYCGADNGSGGVRVNGQVRFQVFRIKGSIGNRTVLTVAAYTLAGGIDGQGWTRSPPDIWATDWSSFYSLQVWGQNPVRLRLVCKKADQIVLSAPSTDYTQRGAIAYPYGGDIPEIPVAFVYNGTQYDYDTGGGTWSPPWQGWNDPRAMLPQICTCPQDDSINIPIGDSRWDASAQQSLVLWEGQDSDASRLLTGVPGIWGPVDGDIYGVAHFYARDITDRLTMNAGTPTGGTIRLSGAKVAGSTVAIYKR
jgi:hypothetical protein